MASVTTEDAVENVAQIAAEINEMRGKSVASGVSLAQQYDALRRPGTSALRSLHKELDAAVYRAYGFSSNVDLLTQLLTLNIELSQADQTMTSPGCPSAITVRSLWRMRAE